MTRDPPQRGRTGFVFAGGGTGGHIYPALAIIEQLRAINPDVDVHILCSNRAIDTKILSNESVPFSPIDAMPVSTRPNGLVQFIASWGPSVRATRACIRSLKENNGSAVLIAMGGFVAAPAARAARAERIPVMLVNLDAVPGKANVLIAKKAGTIFTAAEIQGFSNWQRVRPIVRQQTIGSMPPQEARASFGLDPETNTLLITGGSQGASSITGFLRTMVEQRPDAFDGWQVIHQLGSLISDEEIDQLRAVYGDAGIKAWVERYIDAMGPALSAANLGIARCGAGTVAECWGAKLPAVFFPYPYHKDEHQKHNARVLVDAGTAIVLDDKISPDKNFDLHADTLARLLATPDKRTAMLDRYASLGTPDGADTIARSLLNINPDRAGLV